MEKRDVPAYVYWTADVSADAGDPLNWLVDELHQVPTAGDDVIFDGQYTSSDCEGFSGASGEYESIMIGGSYTGTVIFEDKIYTKILTLGNGALSQPSSATDLFISQGFNWSKGTLNNSSNHSTVHLQGGSVTTIDSGALATVITGSTLSLEFSADAPSTATVNPGTLRFQNGSGIEISEFTEFIVLPGIGAKVTFETPDGSDPSDGYKINNKGTYTVTGKDDVANIAGATSQLPILTDGGTLRIEKFAQAEFKKRWNPQSSTSGSVKLLGENGMIELENGSFLKAEYGCSLAAGRLQTLDHGAASDTATILGAVSLSGATIVIGTGSDTYTTLRIEGNVDWSAGRYIPDVKPNDTSKADLMLITETLLTHTDARIAPFSNDNPVASGNSYLVVQAYGGITGNAPSYPAEWTLVAEVATPITKWFVRKV